MMKRLLLLSAVVLLALFASCRKDRITVSVGIAGDNFLEEEYTYIESLFNGALSDEGPWDILIELNESWGAVSDENDDTITVARIWYAPFREAPDVRTETTLSACLNGEEELLPLKNVMPPHTALRVDGLTVDNEAYPLVRTVRARIKAAAQDRPSKKKARLVAEKLQELTAALQNAPRPLVEEVPSIFWIASAGDLMLGRGAADILLKEGPSGIFGKTAELLKNADLTLVNLEGPVSSGGVRTEKAYNFRFDPAVAPALKDAGIDAVLLANNHIYDYGEKGFNDTLFHLEKAGIGILGAGNSISAAAAPFIFRGGTAGVNEVNVYGIASFPRERSGWDGASIAAGPEKPGILFAATGGAERLRQQLSPGGGEDVLNVVLFHGGNEWSFYPDSRTKELYSGLADAGADLIIGSHPHVVQGFEWVQGKPVFWSLGNYVFAGMDGTPGGEDGLFIRLGFWGKRLVYLEPAAVKLSGPRTDIAEKEHLQTFLQLSQKLK